MNLDSASHGGIIRIALQGCIIIGPTAEGSPMEAL